jgi:hypothetical protein
MQNILNIKCYTIILKVEWRMCVKNPSNQMVVKEAFSFNNKANEKVFARR